jgi:hypothetical protein
MAAPVATLVQVAPPVPMPQVSLPIAALVITPIGGTYNSTNSTTII